MGFGGGGNGGVCQQYPGILYYNSIIKLFFYLKIQRKILIAII